MAERPADDAATDSSDCEPPELEALARRWLDLWQDHWAATAADPHAAAEMARLFRMMAGPFAPFADAWRAGWGGMPPMEGAAPPGAMPDTGGAAAMSLWARALAGAAAGEPGTAQGAKAPGAAAAAASPGDGAGGLAELAERLAAVERRLGQLDGRLAALAERLDRLEPAAAGGKRTSRAGGRGRRGPDNSSGSAN